MGKITKEELLEKLDLQELNSEEPEKVSGGTDIDTSKIDEECIQKCMKSFKDLYKCMKQCVIDRKPLRMLKQTTHREQNPGALSACLLFL